MCRCIVGARFGGGNDGTTRQKSPDADELIERFANSYGAFDLGAKMDGLSW
jgi:hypothetical protein